MPKFQYISKDLVNSLSLQYEPVGVTLYRESESLPGGITFCQKEFKSYCHALVLAGEGETFLLEGPQMADVANSQDDIDALLAEFD